MSRPKPNVLLTTNITDYLTADILDADSLYAVVYKDTAFNLRHRYWNAQGELTKYPKVVFPSLAPAQNLSDKLNEYFNCDDFAVKQIL